MEKKVKGIPFIIHSLLFLMTIFSKNTVLGPHIVVFRIVTLQPGKYVSLQDLIEASAPIFSLGLKKKGSIFFPTEGTTPKNFFDRIFYPEGALDFFR
uniref:Uncharacterized protein n=1 Tax=Lepeophtheirus salmonis TaxID=72036 RepID=A0A0K2VGA5_LEPSM